MRRRHVSKHHPKYPWWLFLIYMIGMGMLIYMFVFSSHYNCQWVDIGGRSYLPCIGEIL